MENDDDMRRIMEPLMSYLLTHVGVTTVTPDWFVPHGHLTKDFFQNAKAILIAKKSLIIARWQNFFQNSCLNALSTHEMYFRYVMFACDIETRFSDNIFDIILNVFTLVVTFNIETLINSWVNFCEFSVDIFMVFYKSTLKDSFHMKGSFEQFAEHLRICNEHHSWEKYNRNEQNEKKIEKLLYDPNLIQHDEIVESSRCESLAKEVLLTTKIQLPPLINSTDEVRLQAARQRKKLALATFSKCETIATAPKHETTVISSKRKTTATSSKRKTTATSSKRKTTATSSKRKTTATSSKRKTTATSSKRKTTATSSKRRTMETTSKDETPELDTKRKTTDTDWKRETTKSSPLIEIISSKQCVILAKNLVKHDTHIVWLDSIAETLIQYINSKCSDPAHENSRFHKEADKFIKQLQDMIKTLVNALEDFEEK
ncbi:unnamed protein product [Larinioides sclopetarius]|uniref:Uncharacterized protein n=1 Tax=Larinioides sclopetarius TaxID=280406 RepID=A0AAV2BT82_9ARAC